MDTLNTSASSIRDVSSRYILQTPLGRGGMGAVFRAHDRLTGQTIALKQVTTPTNYLQFGATASKDTPESLAIALANEFQILASLHHPHIINVLDYGFDAAGQPFFTMEYLDAAQDLLTAGREQPFATRLRFVVNLLEALAYLHRRGLLHRDLKPANVLVQNGQVKVLDFGLSARRDQAGGTAGTFTYMAPEVLLGDPPGPAADIFVAGILACELLTGEHPFDTRNPETFFTAILNWQIKLDARAMPPEVQPLEPVLRRLLARDPDARPTAEAAIADIHTRLGLSLPAERFAIRESFLQAAQFVGREAELAELSAALENAGQSLGSAWLVGGESGVGKSRLLRELRTRALVKGMLVLTGQGASSAAGGQPYQYWRDPVRRLLLNTPVDDLSAGILREIVPDIEALLGRPIPPAPALTGEAARQRLFVEMIRLFRQQTQPILLVMEDLQYAVESLEPLRWLTRQVENLPLLVVGSVRLDEAPDLPEKLPALRLLTLHRLTAAEMLTLSAAMLGEVGARPELQELLRRETEGNIFFIVEVVKALAEETGRLSEIAHMHLPATVFPRGIQTIVNRRLARVPDPHRALLKLAAVAGRLLDLNVLRLLPPAQETSFSLSTWLSACANTSVLEIQDGRWTFAHEKLRDGLLTTLDGLERAEAHRLVANAIESAYPDRTDWATSLAFHWQMAGEPALEAAYARLAGERFANQFINTEAVTYLTRALDLTPAQDTPTRYDLLVTRARVHGLLGARDKETADLDALQAVFPTMDAARQAAGLLRQAAYLEATGDYTHARDRALEAAQLAHTAAANSQTTALEGEGYLAGGRAEIRLGNYDQASQHLTIALGLARRSSPAGRPTLLEASSLRNLGGVAYYNGAYEQARGIFELSLAAYRAVGDPQGESAILNNLGAIARNLGEYQAAHAYLSQALPICQEIGDRRSETVILNNLGIFALHQHNLAEAASFFARTLPIAREIADPWTEAWTLMNQGAVLQRLGDFAPAGAAFSQSLAISQNIGDRHDTALTLSHIGMLHFYQGELKQAQELCQQALSLAQDLGDRPIEGDVCIRLGRVFCSLQQWSSAELVFQKSFDLRRQTGEENMLIEPQAGLAQAALHRGEMSAALTSVNAILEKLEQGLPRGLDDPFWLYLVCFQVLAAANDPRSQPLLAQAYERLIQRAAQLPDAAMQQNFLSLIPSHRQLIELYHSAQEDS